MKKRIISLFLVIAMLVLTLTGCAYNFSKKDMSKYTESLDADSLLAYFVAQLSEFDIKVENEFVNDGTRADRVMDKILANLAAKADTSVTKTEGKPGANDLIYYSYYITYTEKAEDGTETTYLLSPAKMKVLAVSSMNKVQLGLKHPATTLEESILGKLSGIVFGEGEGEYKAYKNLTGSGTEVKDGTVVYISYEREYEVVIDGKETAKKTDVFVSHRVVLDASNPFHAKLIEKHTKSESNTSPIAVGSTVTGGITIDAIKEDVKVPVMVPVMIEKTNENGDVVLDENDQPVMIEKVVDGKVVMTEKIDENGEIVYEEETKTVITNADVCGTYSSLKIEFVEGNSEYATVTDTTYEEKTELDKSYYDGTATTSDKKLDVKDKALEYHIFPAFYVEVPEFNAENVINKIYGESITESILCQLIFGREYEAILEIEDADEQTKALDELKAKYTFVKGEKEYTLAELATELAAAQKALTTADKALKTAKEAYEKAVKAFEDEKLNFPKTEEALATKLASVKEKVTLYENAAKALADAETAKTAAETAYGEYATSEAVKAYEDAVAAHADAVKALENANKELTKANEALTAAQKALEEAAEDGKEAAQAAVDAAQAEVNAKTEAVAAAQAEVDTKAAAVDAAKAEIADFADYEAKKTALNEAKEALTAAGDVLKTTKSDLETVAKAYNDAYTAYKTSYNKVKGTLDAVEITAETAEDANKKVVNIVVNFDNEEFITYTEREIKSTTEIGSLENEMNVAELTYCGSKSEAGKGGAVASQLKAFDAREDLVELLYAKLGANTEEGKALTDADDATLIKLGKGAVEVFYQNNVIYLELEKAYNADIEAQVNANVYKVLLDAVKIKNNKLPKSAVKNAYNDMLDTYKYYFTNNLKYDGTAGDKDNSFYKQYKGSFQKYLTEHVMPNKFEKTGLTYKEALGYLESVAEDYVTTLVKIYRVAEILDVVVDDDEFETYKESTEYQMMMLYAYYGILDVEFTEEAARHAYQFTKIMEVLTANKKVAVEGDDLAYELSYADNKYVGKFNALSEKEWEDSHATTDSNDK